MKKPVLFLTTLLLLMMTQASYGQVVISACTIYNQTHNPAGVVITNNGDGTYTVTINGAMSLGTTDKSVTGTAFYFRKPDGTQMAGRVNASFQAPQHPGDTATFSFTPNDGPIATMGTWTAYATMYYKDSNNQDMYRQATVNFTLPPK